MSEKITRPSVPFNPARYAIFPPSVSLVEEAARRLVPEGEDFSRNLVVFPGKRPAHFLRKVIAQKTGTSFIPPHIFSIEELVDHVHAKIDPLGTGKLETIDAIAFLFEIHRSMERPLGGDQFLSLEAFFPVGVRIYRDLEELVIEEVPHKRLREVEPFIETALPPKTSGGLQSLSFFYDSFYPAIKEAGFSSRSQRYVRTASMMTADLLPYRQIVFAGFFAFTACERRLFKGLLSWENVCFLFQEGPGLDRALASLGIDHRPDDEGTRGVAEGETGRIRFYKSSDAHGQIFALSGILKSEMVDGRKGAGQDATGRADDPSTVIVLPSPATLFPLLYHALPLVSGGYNISLGYPLERTPTWGFLNGLMQLVTSMDEGRFYIPDYLGFVLHPYTKNIYLDGRTEVTRILFHVLEEALAEDRAHCFISLDEIEGRTELFTRAAERLSTTGTPVGAAGIRRHLVTIHDELVRRACTPADIGDFARKMTAVLTFIYDHSSARLHPFFHPFAESFVKELDVLGRSRVSGLSFAERSSYFHFFRRYIGYCFSPFEGTPLKGLQVLGFLETRALSFQRTYLVDANEDVIPDTRKEETFLPLRVREMLGLPTYVDRDMIAAYYFDTLVKGSGEVHLFYVENDRKEKSRFVERLLWERQKREAAPSADGYVRSVVYRLSLEGTKLPTIAKTPAMIAFLKARRYDATSLDAYLVCPLKFYYRYVLDLSRKEDASPDIEKVDVGRLVHTVLFRYFETRRGRRLTEAEIDTKEMAAIVRRTCEEAYGPEPIGSAYLLRRQIARQMKAYLIHYQAAVARLFPVTIIDLECRLDATVHGFRARGIIDRIETRGEKTCIVDYKTSASVKRLAIDFDMLDPDDRSTWGKAIGSLQLPFYLFLYGEHHRGRMGDLAASFLLLGKTHVDERIEAPLFRKEERAEADYDKARRVILGLVGEITDPAIPFGADYRAKDPCVFCDYQYLCGTQRP